MTYIVTFKLVFKQLDSFFNFLTAVTFHNVLQGKYVSVINSKIAGITILKATLAPDKTLKIYSIRYIDFYWGNVTTLTVMTSH